jgi:prepilin-type N-terminal cleavage/methylation domain-containing protein
MSLAGRGGVTLIEVVVATAIFALVVFVLSGFYLTASSRGYLGRTETGAALVAQQRVEVLRAKAYVSLPGFAGTETIDELGNATPDGLVRSPPDFA